MVTEIKTTQCRHKGLVQGGHTLGYEKDFHVSEL